MHYFVYIVKCNDATLYTGITTDLKRRVDEHNEGGKKGARYTRTRRPVHLVYKEEYDNRSSASKRESEIKRFTRQQKLALIKKNS